MKTPGTRRGYTLVEMIVVVLIVGVVAAVAIQSYLRTAEETLAQDARATLQRVARANQMYAADHENLYTRGVLNSGCNTLSCPVDPAVDPCNLVACKYLPTEDWDMMPYLVVAMDGTAAALPIMGMCGSFDAVASCGANGFACVFRKNDTTDVFCTFKRSKYLPYRDWRYRFTASAGIQAAGGAPLD